MYYYWQRACSIQRMDEREIRDLHKMENELDRRLVGYEIYLKYKFEKVGELLDDSISRIVDEIKKVKPAVEGKNENDLSWLHSYDWDIHHKCDLDFAFVKKRRKLSAIIED